MTDPTAKGYTAPQCSCCGYTEEDAKMHMDHHLCRDAGNAPWEVKNALKLPAKAAPAKEYEITGFRETKSVPESELTIPGDQKPHFILRFDDRDMREMVFDDEQTAVYAWLKYKVSWNCWLFAPMRITSGMRECWASTMGQSAPESEDEAFEQAWDEFRHESYVPGNRDAARHFWNARARHFWNARARLDAERGR